MLDFVPFYLGLKVKYFHLLSSRVSSLSEIKVSYACLLKNIVA